MPRHHSIGLALAATVAIAAGCAHSFAETASMSLRGTLEATNATRDLAIETSKRSQEQAVEELEQAAASIPPGDPNRAETLNTLKIATRHKVAFARVRRDTTLEACAKAYRAIGLANALLPLAENDADKKAKALRLLSEAYTALQGVP